MRAKRVVVKVTLPFLLIGMFILKQGQRFYIMVVSWFFLCLHPDQKLKKFKDPTSSWCRSKWCSPYQPLVGHLVRALLSKAKGRVDVL